MWNIWPLSDKSTELILKSNVWVCLQSTWVDHRKFTLPFSVSQFSFYTWPTKHNGKFFDCMIWAKAASCVARKTIFIMIFNTFQWNFWTPNRLSVFWFFPISFSPSPFHSLRFGFGLWQNVWFVVTLFVFSTWNFCQRYEKWQFWSRETRIRRHNEREVDIKLATIIKLMCQLTLWTWNIHDESYSMWIENRMKNKFNL